MYRNIYRKALLGAVVLAAAGLPAGAQVRVDMSLITCGQYLNAAFDQQETIAAWMSGYYNASRNQSVVDVNRFERNKKTVVNYCKTHKRETLMSAIQRVAR